MIALNDPTLFEQLAYYDARAAEYDQWWHREGRYDHGPAENQRWFEEADRMDRALEMFSPSGDVLELACGTGLRTGALLRHARTMTVVDGSAEMLAVHEKIHGTSRMTRIQADLFDWTPPCRFDVVYFGFWLSHVPPSQFGTFWNLVDQALKPGGRFFFIDSKRAVHSAARDHVPPDPGNIRHHRRVNDGREFQVYKVFRQPDELKGLLAGLGWNATVAQTPTYFIYGHGGRIRT